MKKNFAISVRVTELLKKAAEKKAREDSRSLAFYVQKVIAADLRASGHLK